MAKRVREANIDSDSDNPQHERTTRRAYKKRAPKQQPKPKQPINRPPAKAAIFPSEYFEDTRPRPSEIPGVKHNVYKLMCDRNRCQTKRWKESMQNSLATRARTEWTHDMDEGEAEQWDNTMRDLEDSDEQDRRSKKKEKFAFTKLGLNVQAIIIRSIEEEAQLLVEHNYFESSHYPCEVLLNIPREECMQIVLDQSQLEPTEDQHARCRLGEVVDPDEPTPKELLFACGWLRQEELPFSLMGGYVDKMEEQWNEQKKQREARLALKAKPAPNTTLQLSQQKIVTLKLDTPVLPRVVPSDPTIDAEVLSPTRGRPPKNHAISSDSAVDAKADWIPPSGGVQIIAKLMRGKWPIEIMERMREALKEQIAQKRADEGDPQSQVKRPQTTTSVQASPHHQYFEVSAPRAGGSVAPVANMMSKPALTVTSSSLGSATSSGEKTAMLNGTGIQRTISSLSAATATAPMSPVARRNSTDIEKQGQTNPPKLSTLDLNTVRQMNAASTPKSLSSGTSTLNGNPATIYKLPLNSEPPPKKKLSLNDSRVVAAMASASAKPASLNGNTKCHTIAGVMDSVPASSAALNVHGKPTATANRPSASQDQPTKPSAPKPSTSAPRDGIQKQDLPATLATPSREARRATAQREHMARLQAVSVPLAQKPPKRTESTPLPSGVNKTIGYPKTPKTAPAVVQGHYLAGIHAYASSPSPPKNQSPVATRITATPKQCTASPGKGFRGSPHCHNSGLIDPSMDAYSLYQSAAGSLDIHTGDGFGWARASNNQSTPPTNAYDHLLPSGNLIGNHNGAYGSLNGYGDTSSYLDGAYSYPPASGNHSTDRLQAFINGYGSSAIVDYDVPASYGAKNIYDTRGADSFAVYNQNAHSAFNGQSPARALTASSMQHHAFTTAYDSPKQAYPAPSMAGSPGISPFPPFDPNMVPNGGANGGPMHRSNSEESLERRLKLEAYNKQQEADAQKNPRELASDMDKRVRNRYSLSNGSIGGGVKKRKSGEEMGGEQVNKRVRH